MKDIHLFNDLSTKEAVSRLLSLHHTHSTHKERVLTIRNSAVRVLFNPTRIVSSTAKVDSDSIQKRKCFLCLENLLPGQKGVLFKEHYSILVNPFPIFPQHLTIPDIHHTRQQIKDRFEDMLDLAQILNDYIIFYNGPQCGASAPDHMHFQAGNKGLLPIEGEWKKAVKKSIIQDPEATLWYLEKDPRHLLLIESHNKESATRFFQTIHESMELITEEYEPRMNILLWYEADKWICCIFPREKHRPTCYAAEGEENLLISPASVDMGGVWITPLEKDFRKITATDIKTILSEVCISNAKFDKLQQAIRKKI